MSLTELSARTGMALSTVSRIVGALSKHRQKGAPYNLVRVKTCITERRRKELYLTPRGRAVINAINEII
jgi:DNA-binding MarR family transcriptional regulator